MSVCHALREPKLFKDIIGGFPLHHDGIRALNWVALLSFFIESNLTGNSYSELTYDFRNTFENVVTGAFRVINNGLSDHLSAVSLALGKRNYILGVTGFARINKTELLHGEHQRTVLHEMDAEVILKHEEFFLEGVLCLHSVLVLNSLFPHAHKLPTLKLFEERKLFDVVVRVSLDQPLSKGKKLDRSVILIQSETLA